MEEYEKRTKAKVSGMSEGILEIWQDHDNIVTGWHHAREAPLVNEIGKYVFTISAYFQSRGLNSEAEQTFAHALRVLDSSSLPESVSIRARLMTHYGWFLQTSN
jgi:hypothetical protein